MGAAVCSQSLMKGQQEDELIEASRGPLEDEACPSQEYDFSKSTEENHSVSHFVGKYADIRPLLDYSYHKMYRITRIPLQDRLVDEFSNIKDEAKFEMLPWIVFTAGAMGAGKGYVTRWMNEKGYLPLDRFVIVDPDAIRQALPEWEGYVKRGADQAGRLTQKEAGCIAEILGYKALRHRNNVVFDGSLRDAEWYTTYFLQLRREFPGIRIMILHIRAEPEEVLARAEERGRRTGRVVPRHTLIESMEQVPESVAALAPHADFVVRVTNADGKEPKLERETSAPYPPMSVQLTWQLIESLWVAVDHNGDGELSATEVQAAIAQGILTQKVVDTIDSDHDGAISKKELRQAQERAEAAATRKWA